MTHELADISASVVLHGAEHRCPHVIVPNFLGREIVQDLLRHVDNERASFSPGLVYREQLHSAIADVNVRNCALLFPIAPFQEVIEPKILSVLTVALAKL